MSIGSTQLDCRTRRQGFTIVELVTSMVVLVVLLLATSSALFFCGRVINGQGASNQSNLLTTADATDQICDDLNTAIIFNERTATSVCFTVPDRVSAGTPNQIRYSWSGTAGAPLYRQFLSSPSPVLTANTGSFITVLPSANNFALSTLTRQMGPGTAATLTSICSFAASGGSSQTIDPTHFVAQQFLPTLSTGVSTYSIKQIQLALESTAAQNSVFFVRVVVPNVLGEPTGSVLEQEPVYEGSLSTSKFETITVPFKSLTGLSPLQPLCIEIGGTPTGGAPAWVEYQSLSLGLLGGSVLYCTSSNGGSSWSLPSALSCMAYNVQGTVP